MKISIGKSWALGTLIVLAVYGAWFASLQAKVFSEILMLLLWGGPIVGAFTVAYLSPRHKILLGVSMALPASILAGALNLAYESLGNAVDFPGQRGGMILVAVSLAYNVVLCLLGSAFGYFLSRHVESDITSDTNDKGPGCSP